MKNSSQRHFGPFARAVCQSVFAVGIAIIVSSFVFMETPAPVKSAPRETPVPVLAYYYIWYTPGSWDRAKNDFPLLGKYSSDDEDVMRQHIEWAKQAGITGFIVSWKNTDILTPRLEQLVNIAREEDFKLAIIYQGLDFNRNPIPVTQIASDLDYFTEHWGNDPVFSIFDRPLVIWSGTWKYSTNQIRSVSMNRRSRLLLLATERSPDDYARLATYMDGDAYYWSSVNPVTYPAYPDKLAEMSDVVHASHGLWIAPVAPGFDARLIGGTSVVKRNNGATLRAEFEAASASRPDAIGIISWNEFSENSYIEPSISYGDQYLALIASINNTSPPTIPDFDSSEPAGTLFRLDHLSVLGGLLFVIVGSIAIIVRRELNAQSSD